MEDELLKFLWKFFKNFDSTLSIRNEILNVSNVPERFEKFYGKKAPYKFTTDPLRQTEEIELVEKNSYILKTISNYLENSGETTLLKINFNLNTESEIRKNLDLGNSIIESISPKKRYSLFFRFTFHTSFQYLNESEKVINEIYVHEGKILNGDLNGYKVEEGIKSEIKIPDMKEYYFLAKEELKERINNKTQEIADKLNEFLESEIKRIEKHFKTKEKEIISELNKTTEKLIELEKEKDEDKIKRQKNLIKNLKEKLNPEELLNDKERSISLEKNKHALNVNNKLFNTTLIYHPLCCADVKIKNGQTKRVIELTYDPLKKILNEVFCEVSKKPIKKIYLCKNGHIADKTQMVRCNSCNNEFCLNCMNVKCEICGQRVCSECRIRCAKCGKVMCKSHTIKDKFSNRYYCTKCLEKCPRCGNLKIGSYFKISTKTNTKICEDCYRKEMEEKIVRSIN